MENETCKHPLNARVRRIEGYMRKILRIPANFRYLQL